MISAFRHLVQRGKLDKVETANCWFCCQDQVVQSSSIDWWKCKSCEQFNGFSEDGDYRYPVPEMYCSPVNATDDMVSSLKRRREARTDSGEGRGMSEPRSSASLFCSRCIDALALKVRQAAVFVPINPDNHKQEYRQYLALLERQYALCDVCEKRTTCELLRKNREVQRILVPPAKAKTPQPLALPASTLASQTNSLRPDARRKANSRSWTKLGLLTSRLVISALLLISRLMFLLHTEDGLNTDFKDWQQRKENDFLLGGIILMHPMRANTGGEKLVLAAFISLMFIEGLLYCFRSARVNKAFLFLSIANLLVFQCAFLSDKMVAILHVMSLAYIVNSNILSLSG